MSNKILKSFLFLALSSPFIGQAETNQEIQYQSNSFNSSNGVLAKQEFEVEKPTYSIDRNKCNVFKNDRSSACVAPEKAYQPKDKLDKYIIKKNGLAKGGSLENAVVVKGEEILNLDGLRNPKEFVNHKILDCIGDLYTSGYRMIASITCSQGGHYLTNSLLKKVFEDKDNFSIIEIQERTLPHTLINRSLLRSIA